MAIEYINGIPHKRCPTCQQHKVTESFAKKRRSPDGLNWQCRQCDATGRKAHAERTKKRNRQYREQNKEKVKRLQQDWKERNPEYSKQWIAENKEKVNSRSRQWYNDNKEHCIKNSRKWRQDNPQKVQAIRHRRRARVKNTGGEFSDKEWEYICHIYNNQCLRCGATDKPLTPDHVIPLSKGGSNNIDNIQPLCRKCNTVKGTKIIDFRPYLPPQQLSLPI